MWVQGWERMSKIKEDLMASIDRCVDELECLGSDDIADGILGDSIFKGVYILKAFHNYEGFDIIDLFFEESKAIERKNFLFTAQQEYRKKMEDSDYEYDGRSPPFYTADYFGVEYFNINYI